MNNGSGQLSDAVRGWRNTITIITITITTIITTTTSTMTINTPIVAEL